MPHPDAQPRAASMNGMLAIVRFWLPYTMMVGGLVIIAAGGASEVALGVGIPIFSAGASIKFLNALFRLGAAGDEDRDREAEAREFFARHGHWPSDEGSAS